MKISHILKHCQNWMLLALLFGLSFCTIVFYSVPSVAQINLATINEIVDGEQVFIQTKQAKVNDTATLGQEVKTEASRAGLFFNTGAAGRLAPNSMVTVGQCVEVQQGQLVVSGPANGCIAGFSIDVQGTVYVVEKTGERPGEVKVLEGKLTVKRDGEAESEEVVEVKEGEKVAVVSEEELGPVEKLTAEEVRNILSGPLFQGFTIPIPNQNLLTQVCQRLFPSFACPAVGGGIPSVPRPSIPRPSLPF